MQKWTGPVYYVTDVNLVDLGSTEGRGVDRMYVFYCNFQYLILGWSTLVLGPSIISILSLGQMAKKNPKHAKNSKGQIGHILHLLAYHIHDGTIFKIVVTYHLW